MGVEPALPEVSGADDVLLCAMTKTQFRSEMHRSTKH